MKSKKFILVCCICTVRFLFSFIIGQPAPARADVNHGTLLVQQTLQQGNNPYNNLCMEGTLIITGDKRICRMNIPDDDAGIIGCREAGEGCRGTDDNESLINQYQNMNLFGDHEVTSAQVGPEFIINMPCDDPNQMNCGAYVVQWMEGEEIQLSQIGEEVEGNLHDNECEENFDAVLAVTQAVIEQGQTWEAMSVAGIEDGQAAAFSHDMGRIAAFGDQIGKIWDLQGFLQDNGNFFVIDPMAVTTGIPQAERACFHNWTCALGTVVANQHDIDIPDCN